jgi:hypothetical protein
MLSVETVVRYADCFVLNLNFTNILKQNTVTYYTEFTCLFLTISYLRKRKSEVTLDSQISSVAVLLFISVCGVAAAIRCSGSGTELFFSAPKNHFRHLHCLKFKHCGKKSVTKLAA